MLQCKLMAAHLSRSNSDLWKSLAVLSRELGHKDQAIYCFKKAISADPSDLEALVGSSNLYLEIGNENGAIIGFESILECN